MPRPSNVPDSHWMALLSIADKAAVKGTAVFTRAVMTARNQGLDPRIQANLVRAIQSKNAQAVVDSLPWEDYWQSQFDGFQAIFQDVIAQAATAALPNINQVRELTWRKDVLRKRRRRFAKKEEQPTIVHVDSFLDEAQADAKWKDIQAKNPDKTYQVQHNAATDVWTVVQVIPASQGKPKTPGTFNRIRYKFDRTNPDAVAWAKAHAGELITQPADKAAIKDLVVKALEQGVDSKTYAKQVLQYIGMGSQQVASLNKWTKDQTKKLKPGQSIDPAKHQKKVDQLLRKRSQFIALNEALVAAKQGNEIAVQASLKAGDLQEGRYLKEWVLTPDDKLCPICAAQRDPDGELLTVPVGDPWPLKAKGTTIGMIPHAHPRCRCAQALVENPAWIPTLGPEITAMVGGMPAWVPPLPPKPPYQGNDEPVQPTTEFMPLDLDPFTDWNDVVPFVKALNEHLGGKLDYDKIQVWDGHVNGGIEFFSDGTLRIQKTPNTDFIKRLKSKSASDGQGADTLSDYQSRVALEALVKAIVKTKMAYTSDVSSADSFKANKVHRQVVDQAARTIQHSVWGKLSANAGEQVDTYLKTPALDQAVALDPSLLKGLYQAKTSSDLVGAANAAAKSMLSKTLDQAGYVGMLTPLEILKYKYTADLQGLWSGFWTLYPSTQESLLTKMLDIQEGANAGVMYPKNGPETKNLKLLLKYALGVQPAKVTLPPDVLAFLPAVPKKKTPSTPKAKVPDLQVGDMMVLPASTKFMRTPITDANQVSSVIPHSSTGKVIMVGKGKKAMVPVLDATGKIVALYDGGGPLVLNTEITVNLVKDPTWAKTKGVYITPTKGIHWDYGTKFGKFMAKQNWGQMKLAWNNGQLIWKPLLKTALANGPLPEAHFPKLQNTTGLPVGKTTLTGNVPTPVQPTSTLPPSTGPKKTSYDVGPSDAVLAVHTSKPEAVKSLIPAYDEMKSFGLDNVLSIQMHPTTGTWAVLSSPKHADGFAVVAGENQFGTLLDVHPTQSAAMLHAKGLAAQDGTKLYAIQPKQNSWMVVDLTPPGMSAAAAAQVQAPPMTVKPKPQFVGVSAPAPAAAPAKTNHAAVDAAWAVIEAKKDTHFKFDGDAKSLGGAHSKSFYVDPNGERWLFKPVHEPFRALGEELAYRIGRLVNPTSIEVRAVTLDGKRGTIQKLIPQADKVVTGYKGKNLAALDPGEYRAIMAEHVVDWLIGNHDGHADQFFKTKDGTVYAVDKGQIYKFIGQDKLDGVYNPNAGFETPIYNQLRDLVKQGRIKPGDLDLTDAIANVKRAAAISDKDLMDLARPYVDGRSQNPTERARLMNEIVARKQNIVADFERYWSDVLGTKISIQSTTPTPVAAKPKPVTASPDAVIPGWHSGHDAVIADVERAGWQGKSVDFDGGLVENNSALVWQEVANGKPRTVIDLKFRGNVTLANGRTIAQQMDFEIAKVAKLGGTAAAKVRERAGDRVGFDVDNSVFDSLSKALATVKTHEADLAFNQSTLDQAKAKIDALKAQVLATPKTDPNFIELAGMADYYTRLQDFITAKVAALKTQATVPAASAFGLVEPPTGQRYQPYVRKSDEPLPKKPPKAAVPDTAIKSAIRDTSEIQRSLDSLGRLTVVKERSTMGDITARWASPIADETSWKLDMGDGVTIRWYGNDGNVNHFTRRGQMNIIIEGAVTPARVQAAMKKLEDLGIEQVRMSQPADLEKLYLLRHGATNKLNDAVWNDLVARADRGDDVLQDLRNYWSKRLKVKDVTKLPAYHPEGHYEPGIVDRTIGAGSLVQERFDLDAEAAMVGHRLYLGMTGGSTVEGVLTAILEYRTLGMLSSMERARLGIEKSGGMSSGSDAATGGANYVFTRIGTGTSHHIVFKPTLFQRLDRRTYGSDSYGATDPNDARSRNTKATPAEWKSVAHNSSNETTFLNVVSILEHVEVIHAGSAGSRQRIIAMMRSRGIDKMPDGRTLEQVVKE